MSIWRYRGAWSSPCQTIFHLYWTLLQDLKFSLISNLKCVVEDTWLKYDLISKRTCLLEDTKGPELSLISNLPSVLEDTTRTEIRPDKQPYICTWRHCRTWSIRWWAILPRITSVLEYRTDLEAGLAIERWGAAGSCPKSQGFHSAYRQPECLLMRADPSSRGALSNVWLFVRACHRVWSAITPLHQKWLGRKFQAEKEREFINVKMYFVFITQDIDTFHIELRISLKISYCNLISWT